MDRYLCEPCGYVYDPDVGDPDNDIPAGTAFEDLRTTGYALGVDWEKKYL